MLFSFQVFGNFLISFYYWFLVLFCCEKWTLCKNGIRLNLLKLLLCPRIIALQKCPRLHPRGLWLSYIIWQRELGCKWGQVLDGLTLRWGEYSRFSRCAQCFYKGPYKLKGQKDDLTLLILKMEKLDHKPRNVGRWKMEGKESFLVTPKGIELCQHLNPTQWDPFWTLTSRMIRHTFALF